MENPTNARAAVAADERVRPSRTRVPEAIVDLGIWLSGIDSFISTFAATDVQSLAAGVGIINSALRRSSLLAIRSRALPSLGRSLGEDLKNLLPALRECLLLGETLTVTEVSQWDAWRRTLRLRLTSRREFQNIVQAAYREAERHLPTQLTSLFASDAFLSPEHAELALLLPRFARILRGLKIVNNMLAKDEPLKPSLLIFSSLHDQTRQVTAYIANRLERLADRDAELFASLDAASYTVAVELKKVYSQELSGLISLRPAPSLYARIETGYALLNNSFQQIISSLARVVNPTLDLYDLFPELEIKRDRSIILRRDLAELVKQVQQVEKETAPDAVAELRTALGAFQRGSSRDLFFKDAETVERFVSEILTTTQVKDLVPMLHRFGAYLETLFGQVSLRAVLADRPFSAA